jgi:hypothetical protein
MLKKRESSGLENQQYNENNVYDECADFANYGRLAFIGFNVTTRELASLIHTYQARYCYEYSNYPNTYYAKHFLLPLP